MGYFRALYELGELSDRALRITEKAIRYNCANYTAWEYRRRVLFSRDLFDYDYEFKFTSELASRIPKNYQLYHHRQCIIDRLNDPLKEIEFLNGCLRDDAKNAHVWCYRSDMD
jgi:protein farnesyltransferase/geranylgeranyltransferase type-1 subunit alpha